MRQPISKFYPFIALTIGNFETPTLTAAATKYKFALCPKSVDNPFFDVSRDGCVDRARALSGADIEVECIYVGPSVFQPDGVEQSVIVRGLIRQGDLDGLSVSVTNPVYMRDVIDEAVQEGIPVVTFDSDDAESKRSSYIGTDNYFFGEQIGKVLKQIRPEGGTFAIISDTTPNIVDRELGLRDSLINDGWTEIEQSPTDMQGNGTLAVEQMRHLGAKVPGLTAITPVMGAPMFEADIWKALVDDFRNITFVCGDGLPTQLEQLSRAYVHGLVGQLPYEMGVRSIDSLLALAQSGDQQVTLPDFQGTNVLEHLQIPLVLPELLPNDNLLGGLRYVGFVLFACVSATSLGFALWTMRSRKMRVVRSAQPEFLAMVAFGCLIMGATIVPLSFDDSREVNEYMVCMSVPWLAFLGFTITFSALFAKTWRVNRLFHTRVGFERVKVTVADVLLPFFLLFFGNIIVLVCWTVLDPLKYVRKDADGTDGWNRVIATYGICESGNSTPFVVPLAFMNVGLLLLSNYQAYRARGLESEFAESHYIALAVGSLLQATLTGLPLLFLVRELPQAYYLTLVFMIFIICMAVLLFIFVPKLMFAMEYRAHSAQSQRRLFRQSLRSSQEAVARTTSKTRNALRRREPPCASQNVEGVIRAPTQEEYGKKVDVVDLSTVATHVGASTVTVNCETPQERRDSSERSSASERSSSGHESRS